MRIIELQWRNLFSYGNDVQTLDLSDGGKLWQVAGRSGAGKSVIMSLPKLLFFGRTDGVSTNSVANRINKNGWLRGVVVKNGDTYVIERTFSPSGLTVSKNGVEKQTASTSAPAFWRTLIASWLSSPPLIRERPFAPAIRTCACGRE